MNVITRGAQFVGVLSVSVTGGAELPDLSTTPLTYVLDTQGRRRDIFRWRPGGTSDTNFEYDAETNTMKFTLTGTWTKTYLSIGQGVLSILQGDPPDVQSPIGKIPVEVENLGLEAAPLEVV